MTYSPIVVIAGATATGKTEIAIKLAQKFNGYIINGDSRQVFKELNIGTAKPTQKEIEKSKVPHKLFGHVSIDKGYNLFKYQQEVRKILKENPQRTAFLVGGTGLYIDSVVYNYKLTEKKGNEIDRKILEKLTIEELQEKVGEDLEKLNESDRENPRRLIRFLERGSLNYKKGRPLKHIYIVLEKDFSFIEKNIEKRIEKMFKNGLLKENQELFKQGKHGVINTIGYREFREFFEKEITIDEVKKRIFLNTRKYAKRQITWFKRNKNAIWVKDYKGIPSVVLEGF
jgi:tRNA dimethylallyltransferase